MKVLFPIKRDDEDPIDKCKKFLHKYCHPVQIGTGVLFSTVGIGLTAAGVLYADGINFAIHNLPAYIASGNQTSNVIDYVTQSYKGSLSQAIEIGWKQVPLSFCIGYYIGRKMVQKVSSAFGRR